MPSIDISIKVEQYDLLQRINWVSRDKHFSNHLYLKCSNAKKMTINHKSHVLTFLYLYQN
jgi:hypothetical protein